jgi:translation elongation factor EF-1alpha
MNKDINKTLMALVPILKMNGENVTNIEAVHDWYKVGDRRQDAIDANTRAV